MSTGIGVRPVVRSAVEHRTALAWALRVPPGGSSAGFEVDDLVASAEQGRVQLSPVMVSGHPGRILVAAVGVHSPGAVLLLLSRAHEEAGPDRLEGCLRHVVAARSATPCKFFEVLLDPLDPLEQRWHGPLCATGFRFLTRLHYLFLQTDKLADSPDFAHDLDYLSYSESVEDLFVQTVEASYAGTLDCPELTGVRTTREVVAGHRAVGDFDPAWWWVALRGGAAVGVLLLNRLRTDAAEITYLGVAQIARRTGVAGALVRRAVSACRAASVTNLALAVDARNAAARRLYGRHGFVEVQQRDAWIATSAQVAQASKVGDNRGLANGFHIT